MEAYTYSVEERSPIRRRSDHLLVLGSGRCVWDDIKHQPLRDPDVLAINAIGGDYPGPINHWATGHTVHLMKPTGSDPRTPWMQKRSDKGYPMDFIVHMPHNKALTKLADCVWTIKPRYCGTSTMFGVLVGLFMGYTRVLLAGCPLDSTAHYYDPPGSTMTCLEKPGIQFCWQQAHKHVFNGRVRSMSGNTRALLGYPNDEWLNNG